MESNALILVADQPAWVTWVLTYLITLLGSVVMYLFSFNKGFKGATDVLKKLFPEKKAVFYDRLDFILSVFLGAAVGVILFSPSTSIQALAAGLGWVGAVNTIMAKKEPHNV